MAKSSTKRAGTKAPRAPGEPRASRAGQIERKDPLPVRPWFRKTIAVLLSLLAFGGGARVWHNASNARELRVYVRELKKAQEPFFRHIEPSSPSNLNTLGRKFGQAKLSVFLMKKIADTWETDFMQAKTRVAALIPPRSLGDAQQAIVASLDMYAGVARLYNLAAQERAVADKQAVKAQAAFEEKVQVQVQHAQEWQVRAETVYALGSTRLAALEHEWLGIDTPDKVPGLPFGVTPTQASSPPPAAP